MHVIWEYPHEITLGCVLFENTHMNKHSHELFESTLMDADYNRKFGSVSCENRYLWIEIELEESVAVHNFFISENEIEINRGIDRERPGF